MKLSRFLDRLKIKYIRIHILHVEHLKNGKLQIDKTAGFPPAWNDLRFWKRDYKTFKPYIPTKRLGEYVQPRVLKTIRNALFIATGQVNQIFCVDVDSQTFVDYLEKNNFDIHKRAQTVSCRKRLPHLYVRLDEKRNSDKFWIDNVDVGDLKCQRDDGKVDGVFEEDVELKSFQLEELNSDEQELLFSLIKPKKKLKTTDRMIRTFSKPQELSDEQGEIIYEIISYLPGDEIYTYDDWVSCMTDIF